MIDPVASDIYQDQAYDADMVARVMSLRSKLWGLAQSRKIRLDPFELAAAAFATRIAGDPRSSQTEIAKSPEMKRLKSKLETYRRRGMRAAVDRVGKAAYQEVADRWLKFVHWFRYNLLYFKMPSPDRSFWAAMWREQLIQLSVIITKLLEKRFCENLDDQQMSITITLATTSLRRCRHSVGLRDLLRDPEPHEDFLFEFVSKRNELKKLPGAPVPPWQAMMDRIDRVNAYLATKNANSTAKSTVVSVPVVMVPVATVPTQTALSRCLARIPAPKPTVETVETIATPPVNTHNGVPLTGEILCDAIAEWLVRAAGSQFNLIREICQQAQLMISKNLLDQYRGPTVSTSFIGLLQELCPKNPITDANSFIREHAGWLLRVLLALRQQPTWMHSAIGTLCARANRPTLPAGYIPRFG
jgi:hypothetical protein